MQADGNLVIYEGTTARWWTGTGSGPGTATIMQTDGNLVVFAPGSKPVWTTGTYAPGAVLTLQDDGNLVIYAPNRGPLWDRYRGRNGSLSTLGDGQQLYANQQLVSPNGRFRLLVQPDGNVVLYEGSTARWATGTSGPATSLWMQPDGNVVVYATGAVAVWNTQTQTPGSVLTVQDDGNLVIYAPGNVAIWDRNRGPIVPGGTFQHPFPGSTTSQSYGCFNCIGTSKYHTGVDLISGANPVVTPAAGTIVSKVNGCPATGNTGCGSGYGNHVKIRFTLADGSSVFGLFAHLANTDAVPASGCIQAGAALGSAGRSGNVTGVHLHWTMRRDNPSSWPGYTVAHPNDGGFIDPLSLLGQGFRAC